MEYKNISLNANYRNELVKGGGKQQVPCLRIEEKGAKGKSKVRWLYESNDIISYLKKHGK